MREWVRQTPRCLAAVVVLLVGIAAPARAEYLERPVRMFVPFPPGGAVDLVARLLAAHLAADLGRPFLVDSRAGAGGILVLTGYGRLQTCVPDFTAADAATAADWILQQRHLLT